MAAQGAFGTDFYDRSILRPKHRAYYRSGRPVIKIGPIHSAPSLGQNIGYQARVVLLNAKARNTIKKVIGPPLYNRRCQGRE